MADGLLASRQAHHDERGQESNLRLPQEAPDRSTAGGDAAGPLQDVSLSRS
ncbi:MAG TPA: hypothetical protein VFT20_07530 [Candidatus Limnocylindrales bacterium]|nr:hypothetical protein [Candidatus Limnocylindrales bacterium]